MFKLEEIDRRERLLRPGMMRARSWGRPRRLEPVRAPARRAERAGAGERYTAAWSRCPGWSSYKGIFASRRCSTALQAALGGSPIDVLLSDMAPNLSGMDAIDAPRAMYLAELALELAPTVLKPGGDALIKVFQGAGFQELVATARQAFRAGQVCEAGGVPGSQS